MTFLLDAGALIAIDRGDRRMLALARGLHRRDELLMTHGAVIGQVWRSHDGRQAVLARQLRSVVVVPVDEQLGRRAGRLLAASGTHDVVDAALVALAHDGDSVLTSDPEDISRLAMSAGLGIDVLTV